MADRRPSQSDLTSLQECISRLDAKIDLLLAMQKDFMKQFPQAQPIKSNAIDRETVEALDVMTLLSLPDHLRKSAIVACKLGQASADEVSHETGRARAVESSYLNQLVNMGYLKKQRRKRTVIFEIERESQF